MIACSDWMCSKVVESEPEPICWDGVNGGMVAWLRMVRMIRPATFHCPIPPFLIHLFQLLEKFGWQNHLYWMKKEQTILIIRLPFWSWFWINLLLENSSWHYNNNYLEVKSLFLADIPKSHLYCFHPMDKSNAPKILCWHSLVSLFCLWETASNIIRNMFNIFVISTWDALWLKKFIFATIVVLSQKLVTLHSLRTQKHHLNTKVLICCQLPVTSGLVPKYSTFLIMCNLHLQ